jgi:pyruvate dehydrogenase E1 component beta subunit
VSYSRQLLEALRAAEACAGRNRVRVIDLKSVSPLDIDTILLSVRKTGHIIVVEEGHRSFDISAELSAEITKQAFDMLRAPIVRVASLDNPIPFSPMLEKATIPDAEKIARAVKGFFAASS